MQAYVQAALNKSDRERSELSKDKTGVFTGVLGGWCVRAFALWCKQATGKGVCNDCIEVLVVLQCAYITQMQCCLLTH